MWYVQDHSIQDSWADNSLGILSDPLILISHYQSHINSSDTILSRVILLLNPADVSSRGVSGVDDWNLGRPGVGFRTVFNILPYFKPYYW